MHPQPIPVICDRCRAQGLAGEDPFAAFGALLDFDPVPRRTHRADGWDAEVQRAFIAALSLTGSERAACRAVAKSPYGVIQLLAHEGADGFRAAYDEAMAMAADERGRRLAEGVQAVAAEQSGWRPPDQPFAGAAARRGPGRPRAEEAFASAAPAPPPEDDEAAHMALLGALLESYMIKLESERRCRLEGRIAEADFYIRQVTMLEVSIDVVGGNGMEILKRARRGGHDLLRIAETPMSQLLDEARRLHFADCGDPPRPEYPPRHLLVEGKDRVMLEPSPVISYITPEPIAEQRQRIDDQLARDAQAQVEWEAAARRDYERRRAAPPLIDEEPGSAGQPAPEGDRTDVTDLLRDGPAAEARRDYERRRDSDAANNQEPRPAGQPREERTDVTDLLRDGPTAEARRDYERRRDSGAANNQEPRPAGQPAPNGDRTDVTGFTPVTAPAEACPEQAPSAHQPAPEGDPTEPQTTAGHPTDPPPDVPAEPEAPAEEP